MRGESVRHCQGLQQAPAIYKLSCSPSRAALRQPGKVDQIHRSRGRQLHVIQAPERELQTDSADHQR
jgi:hypothetical protein